MPYDEPCLYFFLDFHGNENLHTSHTRLRNPTYVYLIKHIWYSLPFFDDCYTQWQAIRVQMLLVIKLPRNFMLALPKCFSLNKRAQMAKCGRHNHECSLSVLTLPPACYAWEPQSSPALQCHKPSLVFGVWAKYFNRAQRRFWVSIASKIQNTSDCFLRYWF